MKKTETYLFCNNCESETKHIVIYLEDEIRRIKCEQCDRTFGIDRKELLEEYTVETVEHILTEPLRLNKELKEEGTGFLISLPKRLLTKPYRIVKEVVQLLEED